MKAHSNQFIDNAVKALSLLDVSIGRWTGVAKLNRAASKAARDVGATNSAARLYVDLLGKHHAKLKVVTASYAAIRTYLYDSTLPYAADTGGQKRGPRLLPVVRVPEVYGKLSELAADAEEKLETFLKEYDRLRGIAISEDMGSWKKELKAEQKYPSVAEVRAKFRCVISPPRPIPNNAEGIQQMGLPLGMAAGFADQHYAEVDNQLSHAKDAAIRQAQDHMKLVEDQLSGTSTTVNKAGVTVPAKRLHPSLITNSKRVAKMLRDMVEGYDNDPRLLSMADLIDDKVASVANVEVWKNSPVQRDAAVEAAGIVRGNLADYLANKRAPASKVSVAKPKPKAKKAKPAAKTSVAAKKAKRRSSGIVGRKSARNQPQQPSA